MGQAKMWRYEPLIKPVTAVMKLQFSCVKRLSGFFSSLQIITKQKAPSVLDQFKTRGRRYSSVL